MRQDRASQNNRTALLLAVGVVGMYVLSVLVIIAKG